MKKWKLLVFVAIGSLSACATPSGGASAGSGSHPAAKTHAKHTAYLNGKPRPGSKFAKLRPGMSRQEVQGLIGPPTSTAGHITGKQFIPFYFGGDTYRTDWYYKGEGELTFSQRYFGSPAEGLIYIRVNPKESGYHK
ncbi:MAG: hypothetical protein ACYCTF_12625 [Acidiferrobacter sp.]